MIDKVVQKYFIACFVNAFNNLSLARDIYVLSNVIVLSLGKISSISVLVAKASVQTDFEFCVQFSIIIEISSFLN